MDAFRNICHLLYNTAQKNHRLFFTFQDYALLSLPPEFANQLPHDGGAFFTHQTMEEARAHYEGAWRPILHAAAMWLNDSGFATVHLGRTDVDISDSDNLGLGAANAAAAKEPDCINNDRLV